MARGGDVVKKTTTVERFNNRDGDAFAGALKEGMKEYARLTVSGYVAAYWACAGDVNAKLDVFKKLGGQFMKKGELLYEQTDPEEVEGLIISTWGVGAYQLRPMLAGKYYSPASLQYKIGDQGEDEKGAAHGDGVEELVGKLAIAKQLQELRAGLLGDTKREDEGMKGADVQAMLSAALDPLKIMLASSERRAEVAEQRNHELQLKMLDMAQNKQATTQGSMGELIKLLPKEALSALLAPADAPGWAEKAVDALREFGPALAQMFLEYFKPGAAATSTGATALPAHVSEPQPTGGAAPGSGEGRGMPIQLSPEQVQAKEMLLDCIKTKDFDNGYAMLENFPGFMPTVNGPLPIGAAFLGMVDPKITKPRIYVIQMMQLVPELSSCLAEADAFVAYIQQRLMADQEAFLKEQGKKDASGPRPTTTEDDRA